MTDLDMNAACFGRKPLPAGTMVSNVDKMACVVDEVIQFAAEFEANPTSNTRSLMALL